MTSVKRTPHEAAKFVAEMLDELIEISIPLNDFVLTGLLELSAMAARAHIGHQTTKGPKASDHET